MTMAEGMQQIVDDIDSSRAARVAEIGNLNRETAQIRAGTRDTLKSFRSTRKHDATVLHRTLNRTVKANRKVVRGILHEARGNLDEFHAARMESARETDEKLKECMGTLKKDVANIRIDANNMVHGFAEEQLTRGIELSRMLKESTDGIVQDVGEMMDGFSAKRSEIRGELKEGQEVWDRHALHHGTDLLAGKKAEDAGVETPKNEPKNDIGAQVLKVVRHSPKGISLVKTGKKLGIEWRKLVGPARQLLDSGMIRKKEKNYYPVL